MHKIALALLGGGLIGLATSLYWLSHGRIAGISGLLGGLMTPGTPDRPARGALLAGLVLAGGILYVVKPGVFGNGGGQPLWLVAIAGILVGFGTRLGQGCTSGHGICGISRGSVRSIVATLTFMATGIAAVAALRAAGVGI